MKAVCIAIVIMAAQAFTGGALHAGTTLYKSVDQHGHVTFSDAPVSGDNTDKVVVSDDVANVLSSESTQQLIKEQEKADRQAARSEKSSTDSWSERYHTAKLNVTEAERELQDASRVQEGDLVGNSLGGTRPNAAWIERLEQAQANLQARRDELEQLRRQR